ncbi:uncharacterized protein LOC122519275 isoform X1 [Polistes fuscatus]|uniref:uncharacterized protein LOC122519275 isoform X1 n=2 Tax=Polistes fuscatus TaxID=30207 RepID=UPI001CA9727B|nr:uncharacterized protein LOC122519275 isoform X1 [Polistes fuscatus]XP_043494565.1 uncharacterized protein LOC122519275 isoform X1 [Polistes fuscatus]
MESSVQNITCVLLIFAILGCFIIRIEGDLDHTFFDLKLRALFKVIKYVHERPQQMTIGTIYAITLTEVSLLKTILHQNTRYFGKTYSHDLKKLFKFSYNTRKLLTNVIIPINEEMKVLKKVLNDPQIWMREISWKNETINAMLPLPSQRLSYANGEDIIMKGRPNEYESDFCLVEIVKQNFDNKCLIPYKCIQMIMKKDNPRGYPLTHRLLIIQTLRAMRCKENRMIPYLKMLPIYCSHILRDMIDIETIGFPYNTRDLLMEQVVLCGSEGYLEFMDKHYENLILSWSHPSGCYSAFGYGELTPESNMNTDFGCDSHATGLGAASLALFIRKDVETVF